MIIFFNGDFINEREAGVPPSDRGFTLGDGVFDTMLAENGRTIQADRHFARLVNHAASMKLPLPMEADLLPGFAAELLQQNDFNKGRYVIRTTLTRGTGNHGLIPPDNPVPMLIMRAAPAPAAKVEPVRIIVAQTVRRNEHSPLSQIKSLNYGDNILALMEARSGGYEDALLLNTKGNVVCATTSNLFIEENGHLFTPPLSDGVLDGITRALILERAGADEETITPDRMEHADAIYMTNSIGGVRRAVLAEMPKQKPAGQHFEKMRQAAQGV